MTAGIATLGACLLIVLALIATLLILCLLNIVSIREDQHVRRDLEWRRWQEGHPPEVG